MLDSRGLRAETLEPKATIYINKCSLRASIIYFCISLFLYIYIYINTVVKRYISLIRKALHPSSLFSCGNVCVFYSVNKGANIANKCLWSTIIAVVGHPGWIKASFV